MKFDPFSNTENITFFGKILCTTMATVGRFVWKIHISPRIVSVANQNVGCHRAYQIRATGQVFNG